VGFSELLTANSALSRGDIERLSALVTEWQLLADLSFADLILWIPRRAESAQWPEGHRAIAQVRPMTAATVFTQDVIGDEVQWGERPHIDAALSSEEMVRDTLPENFGELIVKEETIPVLFEGRAIAIISRYRNLETMRTPSKLELNYREIANHLYRMVSEGNFPIPDTLYLAEAAPRVGDGLVRLDLAGNISFASPNARSAFSRIGWEQEMEGSHLGAILDSLSQEGSGREPKEANWQSIMSGNSLRREEFENQDGILDLLAIPMTESKNRIGSVVLVHNVTELRRRDRALLTKDATIREIHHRVKNNLQTVSALLRLQSRRTSSPEVSEAIEEAVRRVASIALVHETLASSSKDLVEFDSVISKIVMSAIDLSPRPNQIVVEVKGEFGEIPSIHATPLSLVLTELIHNALEHGLATKGSKVEILANRRGYEFEVKVVDDGEGLIGDFSLERDSGLGLQIVKTLTENELRGQLVFTRVEKGTEVSISFALEK